MNVDWLRTFVEVMERGSYSQAGDALHLSQPAVSQHVKKLEQYMHVQLRDPSSREVRWTTAADRVHKMALNILSEIEGARRELAEAAAPNQVVTVASGPSLLYHYLPRVLANFWRTNPATRVQTRTVVDQASLPLLVRKREVDLALHADVYRVDSLPSQPCVRSNLVPVCSPKHPLAGRLELTASEIGPEKVVVMPRGTGHRTGVEEWFTARGIVLENVIEAATLEEIRAMATDAGVIGFVSEMVAKQDLTLGRLHVLPIADFKVARLVYVSHLPEPTLAARSLLEHLTLDAS